MYNSIRADLAVPFTHLFLKSFEQQSKEKFKQARIPGLDHGLTACAGIAFCKDKFPFHYAYSLSIELCAAAKKASKRIKKEKNLPDVPSSLLFYKIQSSFFTSYQDIVERVLKAGDPGMRFDFGPYYINGDYGPPVEGLLECCSFFKKKENAALESRYEEWLRRVYESENRASLYLERTAALLEQEAIEKYHELTQQLHTLNPALSAEKPYINRKTPLYDIITLNSLGGI